MMNLSRRDFVKTAAVFGGLALTGCGGSKGGSDAPAPASDFTLVKEGTLIVASDLDFEPLGFLKNDKPTGFDVDLSNEIAKRLGLTCEYLEPQVFDDIIPLIKKGGTADVGVSAFSITDDRKKEIDFTESYIDSNQAIVMKQGSDKKGANDNETNEKLNVKGVTVAVQQGTTGEEWVKENLPNATLLPLDNAIDCLQNLSSDKCQAVVADLPCMAYYCKESFKDFEVAVQIATGESYGIVVSKDNPKLTEDMNKAIKDMKADGTIAKIMEKWFGGNI